MVPVGMEEAGPILNPGLGREVILGILGKGGDVSQTYLWSLLIQQGGLSHSIGVMFDCLVEEGLTWYLFGEHLKRIL